MSWPMQCLVLAPQALCWISSSPPPPSLPSLLQLRSSKLLVMLDGSRHLHVYKFNSVGSRTNFNFSGIFESSCSLGKFSFTIESFELIQLESSDSLGKFSSSWIRANLNLIQHFGLPQTSSSNFGVPNNLTHQVWSVVDIVLVGTKKMLHVKHTERENTPSLPQTSQSKFKRKL